jgi:hypothetical protein
MLDLQIKEWEEDLSSQHVQIIHFIRKQMGGGTNSTLLTPLTIPPPRYGRIYCLLLGLLKNYKQYQVTINDYLTCSCVDFSSMMSTSLNG